MLTYDASTVEVHYYCCGNITEADQWAKLKLVKEIAEEVWGE